MELPDQIRDQEMAGDDTLTGLVEKRRDERRKETARTRWEKRAPGPDGGSGRGRPAGLRARTIWCGKTDRPIVGKWERERAAGWTTIRAAAFSFYLATSSAGSYTLPESNKGFNPKA
jgi:hypothetical protein